MGGETADWSINTLCSMGPSPRGRGNPGEDQRERPVVGSIPAWAGKPSARARQSRSRGVHPRVGGETLAVALRPVPVAGPSPRGRGNLRVVLADNRLAGSIPAWAGKPRGWGCRRAHRTVHPRVGGETFPSGVNSASIMGPSPRGRGNLVTTARDVPNGGSIPAWAGKPKRTAATSRSTWVHPRVGGETRQIAGRDGPPAGPSPRGRGNRVRLAANPRSARSIPAWAGKPTTIDSTTGIGPVHPRVGGETYEYVTGVWDQQGPSPRGRGNHLLRLHVRHLVGSIPAWAGKPRRRRMSRVVRGVHPRVGGETQAIERAANGARGPSPRGRGNLKLRIESIRRPGSIPAWAGKPRIWRSSTKRWRVHPRVGGETRSRAAW